MSSPLADLLTVLADIVYKGFYTREDFSLIINNQLVKMVRNLSEEQLLDYNDVLLKLNIFRSKANNNDFMYLKKRLKASFESYMRKVKWYSRLSMIWTL